MRVRVESSEEERDDDEWGDEGWGETVVEVFRWQFEEEGD